MDVPSPGNEPAGTGSAGHEPIEDSEEVEPEAVDADFILKIGGLSTVVLAFLVLLLIQFIDLEQREQSFTAAEQAAFPEQRALEEQSLERLHSYGSIGETDSVYHVPIDQAIEYVADQRYEGAATTE